MCTPRRVWLGLLVATFFVVPTKASAQGPWTVTLTPTFNPLPVGFCGSVLITVFDGRDVARNPLGNRISMADFDMTVSGASVAGHYIDSSHWNVCACQGGTPGSMGTIIASYPAKALAENARVPGIAFQRTATFTLAAPKGTANPTACVAAVATPTAATFQQPVGPATARLPSPPAPADARLATTPERVPEPGAIRTVPYTPGPVAVTLGLTAQGSWYQPAPVSTNLALSAHGTWYEPAPVSVSLTLSAQGTWYQPAPVTLTFDLNVTGAWAERGGKALDSPPPVAPAR